MDRCGLKKGIRPVVSGGKQMRVSPNLRIKGAAARVKDSHYLPAHLAKSKAVAELQTGVCVSGILSHNHFGEARLKHPSLGNFDLLADLEHIGRNATKLHIGVRARGD